MKYSVYNLRKEHKGLFVQKKISSADVNCLFSRIADPQEYLSCAEMVKICIPEALKKEQEIADWNGTYAFVSEGTIASNSSKICQKRTFVWIPLSRTVQIFEGKPFETVKMPYLCSSCTRKYFLKASWGEDPMPVYCREFRLNRFKITATADYMEEVGVGVDPAKKYPPLYFQYVPRLEE